MILKKKDMEIVVARAIVVAKKGAIKEGPMIVVSMKAGKMSVRSAFPQQAGISISGIPVGSGDDVEFVIDGDSLLGILKKVPTPEFDMIVDSTTIAIKSGRIRYKLPRVTGVEAADAREPGKKTFRVMCDDLDKKLKLMIPSTDTGNSYGPYEGVYMKGKGDEVTISASDRKNVVRTTLEILDADPEGFTAIVPTDLSDFLQVFDNEKFIDIEVSENWMTVSQDGIVIWFALLAGHYADLSEKSIRSNIEKQGDKTITKFEVRRKNILDMLSRMEVVADRSNPRIRISMSTNLMSFSCKSTAGSCEDECAVESKGKKDLFMNLYSLKRVLHPLTSDKVELEFFGKNMVLFVKDERENFHAFCAGMVE